MVLTTSLFKVITVVVKNNLIRIIAHHKTKVTMVGFLEPRRCNSRAMAVICNTPGPTGEKIVGARRISTCSTTMFLGLNVGKGWYVDVYAAMVVKICVVDVNFGNMNTYFQQLSRGEVR